MEITLQIPKSLEKDLENIPDRQNFVVGAVQERLERDKAEHEAWMAREIKDSLDEAERGEWVSHEKMKEFFRKNGVNVKD